MGPCMDHEDCSWSGADNNCEETDNTLLTVMIVVVLVVLGLAAVYAAVNAYLSLIHI